MPDDPTSPVARMENAFKQLDLARRALDEESPRYENVVELAYRAKGEGEALAKERGEEWSPSVAPNDPPDDVATDGGIEVGKRPTTIREYRREIHDLLDANETYSKLSRDAVKEAIIELSSEDRRVEESRLGTIREVALRRRLAREADFEYDLSRDRGRQFRIYELRQIYNALTTSRAVTDGGHDEYTQRALERGRPTGHCGCGECVCVLHTYEDDDVCVWCRNSQHREREDIPQDLTPVGYPYYELNVLSNRAGDRFREKLEEYGPGKNWLEFDSEWFLYEAIQNIANAGGPDGLDREELADALNYLLFAMEAEQSGEDRVVTDGGIVRKYDSPHEKLRQEFEILLGQNNTILREMPAYTVGQLFQLVDAARRKYDVGLEEVREEEDGVRLLMLSGGEVSDEIAAAVGIDHPDQVEDLDVHMIDDRKMGGGA